MRKFFKEFKTFISRGSVMDLAVGVIIGSAFTAVVTALTEHILKPIINFILAVIFGSTSLSGIYTVLKRVNLQDGTLDLENSIYIDWGSVINAVINFLLIAFVLFLIVKAVNSSKKALEESSKNLQTKSKRFTYEQKEELKSNGISPKDREKAEKYFADKEAKIKEEERIAAEAKAKADAEAKANSTEALLKDIKEILLAKNN